MAAAYAAKELHHRSKRLDPAAMGLLGRHCVGVTARAAPGSAGQAFVLVRQGDVVEDCRRRGPAAQVVIVVAAAVGGPLRRGAGRRSSDLLGGRSGPRSPAMRIVPGKDDEATPARGRPRRRRGLNSGRR